MELNHLNHEQQLSLITKWPKLIHASAGSGKTATMIANIKDLINKKVKLKNILVITYTKTAANEIKERLEITNNDNKIGTIHSAFLKLLKILDDNYNNYNIVVNNNDIVKNIDFKDNENMKKIWGNIVNLDNYNEILLKDSKNIDEYYFDKYLVKNIMSNLYKYKKENEIMNFNDIIIQFYFLIKKENNLKLIKRRIKYIFIDEIQDLNSFLFEIITKLNDNIYATGDLDQSIFSFLGSSEETQKKILNFNRVELKNNYRSNNNIVKFNNFFKKTYLKNNIKNHCQTNLENNHIFLLKNNNDNILKTVKKYNENLTILVRTNKQKIMINNLLENNNILTAKGYNIEEINIIIYIIHLYKKDLIDEIDEHNYFKRIKLNKLNNKNDSILDIIKILELDKYLSNKITSSNFQIYKFLNEFKILLEKENNLENKLVKYINNWLYNKEYQEKNGVDKKTIHSAKGLQFDNVLFIDDFDHEAEDERLRYVALTRAKKNITILHDYNKYDDFPFVNKNMSLNKTEKDKLNNKINDLIDFEEKTEEDEKDDIYVDFNINKDLVQDNFQNKLLRYSLIKISNQDKIMRKITQFKNRKIKENQVKNYDDVLYFLKQEYRIKSEKQLIFNYHNNIKYGFKDSYFVADTIINNNYNEITKKHELKEMIPGKFLDYKNKWQGNKVFSKVKYLEYINKDKESFFGTLTLNSKWHPQKLKKGAKKNGKNNSKLLQFNPNFEIQGKNLMEHYSLAIKEMANIWSDYYHNFKSLIYKKRKLEIIKKMEIELNINNNKEKIEFGIKKFNKIVKNELDKLDFSVHYIKIQENHANLLNHLHFLIFVDKKDEDVLATCLKYIIKKYDLDFRFQDLQKIEKEEYFCKKDKVMKKAASASNYVIKYIIKGINKDDKS